MGESSLLLLMRLKYETEAKLLSSHVNNDTLLSLCRPKIQASEEMQH